MVDESTHPQMWYSFALVGINISSWLKEWLLERVTTLIVDAGGGTPAMGRRCRSADTRTAPARSPPHETVSSVHRRGSHQGNRATEAHRKDSGGSQDGYDERGEGRWCMLGCQAAPSQKRRSRKRRSIYDTVDQVPAPPNLHHFFFTASTPIQAMTTFNFLYVHVFYSFHRFWFQQKPASIMEFPRISSAFKRSLVLPSNRKAEDLYIPSSSEFWDTHTL
eukprot:GHVO01043051.1.p1 GENE.GHVO01043051.1~~GHVO01043051.1.p1  ORF type:complete len:232 (+),score=38.32 GHVO01043051.1:38-697(+)